jgi:hypothetical protein
MTQSVYTTKNAGIPLLQTISSGCRTPILTVKYCNLIKPFYYPNCKIPRFSITCIIDPRTDQQFLQFIQTIEKNEKIENAIKPDYVKDPQGMPITTGNYIVKFQSKAKIKVLVLDDKGLAQEMKLEDDFAVGEKVSVIYDVLRYTKRGSVVEHGLSFKPIEIIYHPSESTKNLSSIRSEDGSDVSSEDN